jgi:hypothetical protein
MICKSVRKINSKVIVLAIVNLLLLTHSTLNAQDKYVPTEQDKKALKKLLVEKYYVSTEEDSKDLAGGKLATGSVCYRLYLEIQPGYKLQTVYGSEKHPLIIETSTSFFNDTLYGHEAGDKIIDKILSKHSVCVDSWVSMGAASNFYNGIALKEDNDGSIIKGKAQLQKADGLLYGNIFATVFFGNDMKFFKDSINAKRFYMNNGAWANLLGAVGPTDANKILIAQLTTNGKLSFDLNVQLGTPTGGFVQFVAQKPENDEVLCNTLQLKSK